MRRSALRQPFVSCRRCVATCHDTRKTRDSRDGLATSHWRAVSPEAASHERDRLGGDDPHIYCRWDYQVAASRANEYPQRLIQCYTYISQKIQTPSLVSLVQEQAVVLGTLPCWRTFALSERPRLAFSAGGGCRKSQDEARRSHDRPSPCVY
jgi:hypothetical protein